ncbi:PDZ domain-containing protein [Parabacteroides sp. Marseille-P3160]|uniref:PDZ domain-containing protein n=1 Tax=Parabacteroides sp. Marseille-P3160 TaxID=1917887 RepID=UPI0009BC63F6|nr:PDZ domain-containing protein [Parabacteroides sp. Marseille-P3160]
MKKVIFPVLFIFSSFVMLFAQNVNDRICRLGLTYEVSTNKLWGNHKPVVISVYPYSPAEMAGLKQNDIIEKIDGISVLEISEDDLGDRLNPADRDEVVLTVSNLSSEPREILVKKECKRSAAIAEEQLASAFSMYSLESTVERTFVCPFNTMTTRDAVDLTKYKTFAFSSIDENNSQLENSINASIRRELTNKGLRYSTYQPDLLVETYYLFDTNPNYKGRSASNKEVTYRYDFSTGKMVKLPFLNVNSGQSEGQYILQFGFRFLDQRMTPGRVLWECEANELLNDSYSLDDYVRVHIPLMCMQYPYVKYNRNVLFRVSQKSYNYTGISYNIDRLYEVADVDPGSPAGKAGIAPGDRIEQIEGKKLDRTTEEYTSAYKQFITSTMKLRDKKTMFTDANGFTRCMFWDTFKYPQVAKTIQNPNNLTVFSYLYYFAPYVNPSGNNQITFTVQRGNGAEEIGIRPEVRKELTIEIN